MANKNAFELVLQLSRARSTADEQQQVLQILAEAALGVPAPLVTRESFHDVAAEVLKAVVELRKNGNAAIREHVEACRQVAVRRMTGWTKEDDARSQDFRDGVEKAASDVACAIAKMVPGGGGAT